MTNETTIPETFDKYGTTFTLLRRVGRALLYRRVRKDNPLHRHFEVMVVQQRKETVLGGRTMSGGEALPSSSMWGTFGWTYLGSCEDDCMKKFKKVCKHFNPERKLIRNR